MDLNNLEKKTERISKQQKEKLVEFMASNLEFARGQFIGVNSNTNYKEQWETLKVYLNSLGAKSVEQWKKCWIDLKSIVKKTVSKRRNFINKTGGGSWAVVPRDLNPLEEKILQVITFDAVDGDACTPESGVILEESFEEFISMEVLDCDELYMPASKKSKTPNSSSTLPSTSKAFYNESKKQTPALSTNSSKFNETLNEARKMQEALMNQLNNMQTQIELILKKIVKIEEVLEEKSAIR